MNENEELITRFYRAFQQKDYATMQECYAGSATFSDPVFRDLNAWQVRAMWEMLLVKSKDLIVEFGNLHADAAGASAEWTAIYTFSATGRKVVNRVKASFVLENGKIVQHTDRFNFYKWASQALGVTGKLLGWSPFIKNEVRLAAMKSLETYMSKTEGGPPPGSEQNKDMA